jgi:aminopeptidase-like protein
MALNLAIQILEKNCYPVASIQGEPHMSKRGAYPTLSVKSGNNSPATLMNFLTWSDGKHDLIDIAKKIKVPAWDLFEVLDQLYAMKLITINKLNTT